jgi:hypothetical protein
MIELFLHGNRYRLPVRIMPSLPEGMAGVPTGIITQLNTGVLPSWGRLTRGGNG